jgi:hypothetical protein
MGLKDKFTRRGFLPILGSSFLLPFLGLAQAPEVQDETDDAEYEILLKPDGTPVKVRKSTLKQSKVVQKNISNKSFLKWLGLKE